MSAPLSSDEPRRPRRLWLRIAGVVLVLIVAGVAIRLIISSRQAQARLQAILDELDASDPGWRLEQLEKSRADVPDSENSARIVSALRRRLPSTWLPQDLSIALGKVPPQEQLPPDLLSALVKNLDRFDLVVADARKLEGMPRGRYSLTSAPNPVNIKLDDQQHARVVTDLLIQDARRLAQQGDAKEALRTCRAALCAGRSLGDEPIGISQLIRSACVSRACQEVERVLAQGVPPEEDLAALQRLLEDEDRFPTLLVLLRGERAFQQEHFERIERGEASLGDDPPPSGGLQDRLRGWSERRLVGYERPFQMRALTGRVEAAKRPLHEQPAAIKDLTVEEDLELPSDAFLTRLVRSALDKMCESAWRKHAQVRSLIVLIAVERFRQALGRWPARLDELTPRFLDAVPMDPFDGKPLRYRRLADGVVVYSVGEDRTDNGGVLDRENPRRPGADLGYRLWDVEKRRQPPAKEGPAKKDR